MIPSSRLLRMLTAAVVLVATAMPGAAMVHANGLGDLYVGVKEGVKELYLLEQKDLFTVPLDKEPTQLAFNNNGRSLYAGDGRKMLVRIDIQGPALADSYPVPADVPAIAYPKGDRLYLAVPSKKALYVLADGETEPIIGPQLEGEADLLAADRREYRIVAAQSDKDWVDIVDTNGGGITKVQVEGKVVALSVAADEGVAYVAMHSPDQVAAIDLDKGDIAWTVALAQKPTDVTWAGTETPRKAIVAMGDKTLVWASEGKTASWATLEQAPGDIATADEGAYIYAATKSGVTTVNVDDPTARPPAEVELDNEPATLAPVPKASSLTDGGQEATSGSGTGGETGNGGTNGDNASPTKAPATDTDETSNGRFRPSGPDPVVLLGGAALIALIVVFGMRSAITRWMHEP